MYVDRQMTLFADRFVNGIVTHHFYTLRNRNYSINTSYPLFRRFQDQRWIDRCKDREINGGYIQIDDFIFKQINEILFTLFYTLGKFNDQKLV